MPKPIRFRPISHKYYRRAVNTATTLPLYNLKEKPAMSTKFEQLLDYLVNEEHDKANELFHEIVVEKSRSIYENLIAEEEEAEMDEAADEEMDEAADEEEMDESADEEADESVEEAADEEADESVELEDSYEMETDDGFGGGEEGDATDELGAEIGADGEEEGEDSAMMDIKNAIQELEAAFAELEQAQGIETGDSFGDEEGGEEDEMEMMGLREYREKVGNDWEKNSQKSQGQLAGAGTGDKEGSPTEGKSAINTNADRTKPTSGANAKNLNQSNVEGQSNTGTSPGKVNKGITPEKGEKFAGGIHNVDGVKSGVKTLSKVSQNSKTPGPVGSGTGDKAGQTSVSPIKPFLKKL